MTDPIKVKNETTYRVAMESIVMAANLIRQYDLPGMIESINFADRVGPFVDPTMYMHNAHLMHKSKEIIEAALPLWRLAERNEAGQ